jgi:hypothetical protein
MRTHPSYAQEFAMRDLCVMISFISFSPSLGGIYLSHSDTLGLGIGEKSGKSPSSLPLSYLRLSPPPSSLLCPSLFDLQNYLSSLSSFILPSLLSSPSLINLSSLSHDYDLSIISLSAVGVSVSVRREGVACLWHVYIIS